MTALGASLAVAAGLGYNASAALEKREAMAVGSHVPVVRLLPALARRPVWMAAMGANLLAWGAEAWALASAPIAVVVPLLNAGRIVLVALGIRWLHERFGWRELVAVALTTAGAATAAVSAGTEAASRVALHPWPLLLVAGAALAVALIVAARGTGLAYGAAAGCLYAATAVFTKEIGDRVAVDGWSAPRLLLTSPTPYVLLGLAAVAQAFVQAGLQRANAASVASATGVFATIGPIIAGFVLYHEAYPPGLRGAVLGVGIAAAVAGGVALAASHGPKQTHEPGAGARAPSP